VSTASLPALQSSPVAARAALPHFPAFDALRGYAICGVLIVHCSLPFLAGVIHLSDGGRQVNLAASHHATEGGAAPLIEPFNPAYARIVQFGANGVQLFYIVSACTLFWSLYSRTRADRKPLAAFFLRRFFRIAPAFWLAIIASLCIDGRGPRYNEPNGITNFDLISTFLFAHGWTPGSINSVLGGDWSIAVEMSFYLILPFCFLFIRKLSHAFLFIFAAYFLNQFASSAYTHLFAGRFRPSEMYLFNQFLTLWLPSQLPIFGFGFALFFLVRDRLQHPGVSASKLPNAFSARPNILLIGALMVWAATIYLADFVITIPTMISLGIILLLFAWLLIWFPIRLLVNPLIGHVGKVSYSMYLCHFLLLHYLVDWVDLRTPTFSAFEKYGALLAVTFVATVAVATVSYFVVEQPMIRFGKHLLGRLQWGPASRERTNAEASPAAAAPI